jgi:hypothetical protein
MLTMTDRQHELPNKKLQLTRPLVAVRPQASQLNASRLC